MSTGTEFFSSWSNHGHHQPRQCHSSEFPSVSHPGTLHGESKMWRLNGKRWGGSMEEGWESCYSHRPTGFMASNLCRHTGSCTEKGHVLGLMHCCCCPEILNVLTRDTCICILHWAPWSMLTEWKLGTLRALPSPRVDYGAPSTNGLNLDSPKAWGALWGYITSISEWFHLFFV